MPAQKLDKVDAKIMQILSKDGRISWRDLADQIGLSLTPTLRRIRRLENEGVITGYSAQFDEQKLGFGITMYVWVSLERQVEETLKVFERRIADVPEVMSCYLMTGEADYVLRIVVPDLPSYQRFMLDVLTRIPGVSRIQSGLAIKPVFQRAAPAHSPLTPICPDIPTQFTASGLVRKFLHAQSSLCDSADIT